MNCIYTQNFYLSDKNWIIQNKITHVLEEVMVFHMLILLCINILTYKQKHTHTKSWTDLLLWTIKHVFFSWLFPYLFSLQVQLATFRFWSMDGSFSKKACSQHLLCSVCTLFVLQLWQECWWTHNRGRSERGMCKQKLPFSLNTSRSSTSLNSMQCVLLLCVLSLGFPLVIMLLLLLCLIAMHVLSLPEEILSK